ncbi:MAG TPA: Dps family protein, partial [Phototrophicaceae bacterium]|nr:Dps family protein [Phototrophicaceae bacterium]
TTTNGKTAKAAEGYPNIGLSAEAQAGVVKILSALLADEFVLYTRLRKYHWNVTGPEFFSLHASFEKQYEAIAEVIDQVAERIRTYGVNSPGTLEEFKQHARLTEQPGVNPDAHQMVLDIVADHEALVRYLREDIETIDDKFDDVGAEDLLTGLMQSHQTNAWMMRSLIQGKLV